MQTCKQLYQEAQPFFYQNTFKLHDNRSKSIKYIPSFKEHVKKVSIDWPTHSKERDSSVLRYLATCKSLEVLDIRIPRYINQDSTRQKLYQGMVAIQKFNKCANFDNLVRICVSLVSMLTDPTSGNKLPLLKRSEPSRSFSMEF